MLYTGVKMYYLILDYVVEDSYVKIQRFRFFILNDNGHTGTHLTTLAVKLPFQRVSYKHI